MARADATINFLCCSYSPLDTTIDAGESVTWVGTFMMHPLRQVDGPMSDTAPPGGFSQNSGTSFTFKFNTPGTYYYQCILHGVGGGTMRGSITVRAAPVSYSVTYDGNGSTGGSVPVDSNTYPAGAMVSVPDVGSLTRTGYTFTNWNTAANGSGISYAAPMMFTMSSANITLYAQWAPVSAPPRRQTQITSQDN